jgi:hypothetical protein
MATTIDLTAEQITAFDEYIQIQQTIKELTEKAEAIRVDIDQCVKNANAADDEAVVLIINDHSLEFSVVAKSFKFDYDIVSYISETNAFDTLTVSSTAAKKSLSNEQVEKYFKIENGSRRLKIK